MEQLTSVTYETTISVITVIFRDESGEEIARYGHQNTPSGRALIFHKVSEYFARKQRYCASK